MAVVVIHKNGETMTFPDDANDVIVYPDSDGNPMADNTLQADWIMLLKTGLDDLFADDPNVFVAADLLWYPVEGAPRTRVAPDVFVAFGRPKGYRGSYMQWRENGIAPQVVFEILSPGNSDDEMERKRTFYERFGVAEYYVYEPGPDKPRALEIWARSAAGRLISVAPVDGFISPRLGIRFEFASPDQELVVRRLDGRAFQPLAVVARERDAEHAARERAEAARDQAEADRERLAARLRALGVDPDAP